MYKYTQSLPRVVVSFQYNTWTRTTTQWQKWNERILVLTSVELLYLAPNAHRALKDAMFIKFKIRCQLSIYDRYCICTSLLWILHKWLWRYVSYLTSQSKEICYTCVQQCVCIVQTDSRDWCQQYRNMAHRGIRLQYFHLCKLYAYFLTRKHLSI